MAMTPERRVYAEKRIQRLNGRIIKYDRVLTDKRLPSVSAAAIRKERASCVVALKRWEKELADAK